MQPNFIRSKDDKVHQKKYAKTDFIRPHHM